MKSYEFRDTFIKKCAIIDGIGECKKHRESMKCVDGTCKKVNYDKLPSKINVLQEHYKADPLIMKGGSPDPKLQRQLIENLKKKYKCMFCGKYKYMEKMIEHIKSHKNLPPKKRFKFTESEQQGSGPTQKGGCGACMFGGCGACMVGGKCACGGGRKKKDVNKLKVIIVKKLKEKYRCPMCNKYKYLEDMDTHLKKRHLFGTLVPPNTPTDGQIGSGDIRSQYYGKKSSVNIKVPQTVKNTALYAMKLGKLGFKGGLETGWKRAKQLATKETIPIEDLRYMKAWFARHVYTSYPGYHKWVKAGRPKDSKWHNKHAIISWLIWSGDAAFKWVNSTKNINLLNKHYPGKNYTKTKLPK
jgi:transcription elongation factor Elf1